MNNQNAWTRHYSEISFNCVTELLIKLNEIYVLEY